VLRHVAAGSGSRFWRGSATVADLQTLLGRFIGPERANESFAAYARSQGIDNVEQLTANAVLVHYVESQIAGAIGSASARDMVASVVVEEPLALEEVMTIIDEASQALAYSRQLEQKSLELEAATNELLRTNQRLQELDRLKDDFISTVTHELRTPLTSIRAFSEILGDNPNLETTQRAKFLGIITRESERLTRLINQVLDLAKIESGAAEWHPSALDMREVIEDATTALSQIYKERGIELTMECPGGLPVVYADRDRIFQVVLNLLSNAANFCDKPESRVRITVAEEDTALRIEIADNGIGISMSDQNVIFEKFRQVSDAIAGKPKGSGLGLAISREIVQHYQGRLWVESTPGVGSTFSFTLPLPRSKMAFLAA
jgi:signal transduction histidine kinase